MKQTKCKLDQLTLLVAEKLPDSEARDLLQHLEECTFCQEELQAMSADGAWWERARSSLADVATDEYKRVQLPDSETYCIETVVENPHVEESRKDVSHAMAIILDPPSHPETLGRIEEFEIERKIGQGGMGVVFRGFDHTLNRPVAIKVLAPHLGANENARQRFAREAQAAAAIMHPNVVPIHRVSSTREHPYIAMALVDGRSLQEQVAENGPFDVRDVVRIGIQIASGLAAAHKQGLIHRDIKPANVLMEKDVSRVMITDFGLARAVDDVMMTQSGCLAGTPGYMAPEQVRGEPVDSRSDLFSLGSLLYFIATGYEPFRADGAYAAMLKIINSRSPSARSLNPDVPDVLNRIIDRLLEKKPADRIQSAEELESLLTRLLAHMQQPSENPQPYVKPARSRQRLVVRRIVMALGAIGLIGYLAWISSAARTGDSSEGGKHPTGEVHHDDHHPHASGHQHASGHDEHAHD